jgi:competence protein CoiA
LEFAIHDGVRKAAFKGGSGTCPTCGAAMTAKCGPRVMHHWAHAGRRNCDPWWENETPWHREWKSRFPESFREIAHVAPDGEIHRADIKTEKGIVIEIQHSAMSDAERLSREEFYRNLVWIIDGRPFRKNFEVFHALPDPHSELGKDVVWYKARRHLRGTVGGMFFRLSENRVHNPDLSKSNIGKGMVEIHGRHDIEEQIRECYLGHHQYDWVRPRQTWLEATCPVFIDFGTDFLLKLETYDETGLPCVRHVARELFVRDAQSLESAQDIGRRSPAWQVATLKNIL